MEIPPEVRYVMSRGKNIAFQRWGSGDRRGVAISPALGNLDLLWTDAALYDAFLSVAERFEFVIYDQLGQGLSDPIDHLPTWRNAQPILGR